MLDINDDFTIFYLYAFSFQCKYVDIISYSIYLLLKSLELEGNLAFDEWNLFLSL